jgi:hypothetical protein
LRVETVARRRVFRAGLGRLLATACRFLAGLRRRAFKAAFCRLVPKYLICLAESFFATFDRLLLFPPARFRAGLAILVSTVDQAI